MKPLRYTIFYTHSGPKLGFANESCRDYPCCGGTECGLDFSDVRHLMAGWYEDQLASGVISLSDRWYWTHKMTYWLNTPEDELLEQELGYEERREE